MKPLNSEIIGALTPIFLGAIGGAIGIAVLVLPLSEAKSAAGFGLAGTAIAGAAGLAQNSKNEYSFSAKRDAGSVNIEKES